MYQEKFIARSYVMTENSIGYKLEYYIFSEPIQNGMIYGITIKQYEENVIKEEQSEVVSKGKEDIEKLIDCFARNFVFPCSLIDIIADMGQANRIPAKMVI